MLRGRPRTELAVIVVTIMCGLLGFACGCGSSESGIESAFDAKYQTWLDARNDWVRQNRTRPFTVILPETLDLEAMGPRILPFMIKKLEDDRVTREWNGRLLVEHINIVQAIAHKSFPKGEYPDGAFGRPDALRVLLIAWWNKGRAETPQRFRALHKQWTELLDQGKTKEADAALNDLVRMGIEALPLAIDEVRNGDERCVPLVTRLMRKKVLGNTPTREAALQWWEQNREMLTLPPIPPEVPVAGGNRSVPYSTGE